MNASQVLCGRTRQLIFPVAFVLTVLCGLLHDQCEAAPPFSYNQDVRPILAGKCFACHGRDESARQGDLRLDVREEAIARSAINVADPESSELISRIVHQDPALKMPPTDSGHKLSEKEIETLREWIGQGAHYEAHWAFIKPVSAELPSVQRETWPKVPLDYFVLARLEATELVPAKEADRAQWLRRVTLDLTGLPPTFEDLQAFLTDDSSDAFGRVVDRLLQSPAYGEHWARMWLDLARYADTRGYEKDRHRDIWRYRDWVIAALNADMPFDQFTKEQLAGDLLPGATADQILATAFHRNTMTNEEGGTDDEEFRVAAVKDRVDTTIQVWMGLTMGCAKCHSHKYDPIGLDEYYQFYAFFNQSRDTDTEGPLWPTPTLAQQERIARLEAEVTKLTTVSLDRPASFAEQFATWQQQFEVNPLWNPASLIESGSQHDVKFHQGDSGVIIASGERPERDVWTFTFEVPATDAASAISALRIEHFPQADGGGDWPDANVALRELTVEAINREGTATKLELTAPRASFSQAGWSVERVIDGNLEIGWALSPHFQQRHTAVFNLHLPPETNKIRITLDQQYGQSLLLARSRFSFSTYPVNWLRAEVEPNFEEIFASQVCQETVDTYAKLAKARLALEEEKKTIPQTPVMLELPADKLRTTKIHVRGNFLDQGDAVSPAIPQAFGTLPPDAPANRLGVAAWLTHPDNPLTSRVLVNRIWARLFGVGIVETEEDFGTQGMPPSHPQLLDFLAAQVQADGWSIKKLLRHLVLSATYRQDSSVTPSQLEHDPRNRLLGRGPRFRLSAEAIRDQALAVSGLLSPKIGGPSVMPPQPEGVWKSTYSGEDWRTATDEDRYRRGIYTYIKRTSPYPAFITFDAGSGEVCQIRRVRTNTPLQALVTLNDTVYLEAAGALARRMEQQAGTLTDKLTFGFQTVLTRNPTSLEMTRLMNLYENLEQSPDEARQLLTVAGRDEGDVKLVAIASVLLNLDETMTKP